MDYARNPSPIRPPIPGHIRCPSQSLKPYNRSHMQPALRSSIPDASLAVFPVYGEKSHQGLAGRNPAPNQAHEVCNFTVLLGLLSTAVLNRVGPRSTGKERDTESGNDYFMARYYSSAMGRFMSPDWAAQEEPVPYAELDDPQSLNLYAYVRNNPLTRVDEDGHAPMSWGGFQNCASNNSNDDCQRQHNAEAGYGQMTDAELSKREGEQRQWLINNATSDASKDLASKADGPTVFHLYMCVNFGDCGKTSYDSSIIQLVNSPGVKAAVQAAATVLTGLPSGAIKLRGNQVGSPGTELEFAL